MSACLKLQRHAEAVEQSYILVKYKELNILLVWNKPLVLDILEKNDQILQ